MLSFIFKTLFLGLVLCALASPLSAQSTVGSPRISTPGGPEFTFQIPINRTTGFHLCGRAPDGRLSCSGIAEYIAIIYRWLVGFAAIVAVLAMTWGGVQWLISRGESSKIQEAQKIIGNAVIGLAIALLSYLLLATIGKDYVAFRPIQIKSIDPLALKLAALSRTPSTSSTSTRAGTSVRTTLPTSIGRGAFEASCTLECTTKGAKIGKELDPVVTEKGSSFECTCKERETGVLCTEPDTELSHQPNCADIFPVGEVILPRQHVLRLKEVFTHTDASGAPYYCCSALTTPAPPTCGSRKDLQCCGVPDGDVVCQQGLYAVKKTTFTSENKCFCYTGSEGAICNAETGEGCASGFTCKKLTGFLGISFAEREDGECKR